MARKAMEDQRMSGPAPQDDEQDLTGEEDSDSSSSEVEVLWHKKRQASPVNREDDLSVAAKRPRPSSSGKPFDITIKWHEAIPTGTEPSICSFPYGFSSSLAIFF
ncbi:hypothetical protein Trihar35433_10417 [Trichoderma harzianum]|nr:hypothetical protein Trihar35433_10417 [Trichoderma harzianum]